MQKFHLVFLKNMSKLNHSLLLIKVPNKKNLEALPKLARVFQKQPKKPGLGPINQFFLQRSST